MTSNSLLTHLPLCPWEKRGFEKVYLQTRRENRKWYLTLKLFFNEKTKKDRKKLSETSAHPEDRRSM